MRCLLAFTVLISYLAVLLAGNCVPQEVVLSAEHPYVHSKECQEQNYLLLDCWDKCNGDYLLQETKDQLPFQEAIVILSALDVHTPPEALTLQKHPAYGSSISYSPSPFLHCNAGFAQQVFPPPRFS